VLPNITKLIIAPILGVTLCCVMLSGCGSGDSDDLKTTAIDKDGEDIIKIDTPRIKEDAQRLKASPTSAGGASSATGSNIAPTPPPK
jgi:hypothetical protein